MDDKALALYIVGHQFLNSSQLLIENLVSHKNKNVIISDHELTDDEFDDKTKYCDYNIIIPILYNYYHGIELIMKAALEQVGQLKKVRHDIKKLSDDIKKAYSNDSGFARIITDIIDNPINIVVTFEGVNQKITDFTIYEALRYPDKKDSLIEYGCLMYNGERVLSELQRLNEHIESVKDITVKKYRELK